MLGGTAPYTSNTGGNLTVTKDPTQPVFDRADVVRTLQTRRPVDPKTGREGGPLPEDRTLLADVQALVLVLHAWETGGTEASMQRKFDGHVLPCGRCAGTGWEGQVPCAWCSAELEVGMYQPFKPADAKRRLNHLASMLRRWKQETTDEMWTGVEVKEKKAKVKCAGCQVWVSGRMNFCPECGTQTGKVAG